MIEVADQLIGAELSLLYALAFSCQRAMKIRFSQDAFFSGLGSSNC